MTDLSRFKDEREINFAQYVALHGLSPRAAALKAGYAPSTADNRASQWIHDDPRIRSKHYLYEYLLELKATRANILGINEEWVLDRLKAIADVNICDFLDIQNVEIIDKAGVVRNIIDISLRRPFDQLTRAQQRTIKKIKNGIHGFEIEFYDTQKALEQIAKFLGMYDEDFTLSQVINTGTEESIAISATPAEAQAQYLENIKNV